MTDDVRRHWDDAYAQGERGKSWFQERPEPSLTLITQHASPGAAVIDVGGGASSLPDALLGLGYADLTVLDVSPAALAISRTRLGTEASRVTWVEADLLTWTPPRAYDVWHDRAVFHFLTDDADVAAYRDLLRRGTAPGSVAIIATFGPQGPERCSGLPTRRYAAGELVATIGDGWTALADDVRVHRTPAGADQQFTWLVLRRDS